MAALEILVLLDDLAHRHVRVRQEVHELRARVAQSDASPKARAVFEALADAVGFHIQREERFLFPAIRALLDGEGDEVASVRTTLATMQMEHEELLELQESLRGMVGEMGALGPRLVAFLDFYEAHNEAEDNVLFPRVLGLLDEDPVDDAIVAGSRGITHPAGGGSGRFSTHGLFRAPVKDSGE